MNDVVVMNSRYAYAETIERLCSAIQAMGATVFAQLDQSRAADSVGLSLRPTTLVIFGNPKAGTPLMRDYPLFALELPLKLLVWEDGGAAKVAYTTMKSVAQRYGLPESDKAVALLDHSLSDLIATTG